MCLQGLLATWNATSDPCDDAWAFTSCACADVYPSLSAADCANVTANASARHVLVLEIGPVIKTQGRQLAGSVSASLGNLTSLRILDLHGNLLHVSAFWVILPGSLFPVPSMRGIKIFLIPLERALVVTPNACVSWQGMLPASLGRLRQLEQFVMSDNSLSGNIPAYVGGYPGMGEAWLDRNKLSGPLPASLCDSPVGKDRIHLQVMTITLPR